MQRRTAATGAGATRPRHTRDCGNRNRAAFTLIELMIGIFIIIILAAIAIPIAGSMNRNEAVTGTSRQVSSFLEGARDRAIQSKLPRGVRLMVDENDPTIVTSLVYVGPAGNLSEGTITILNDPDPMTPPGRRQFTPGPQAVARTWKRLRDKGLIPDGSVLKLRASSGGVINTYTIYAQLNASGGYDWYLTKDYAGTLSILNGSDGDHVLELGNSVLANQEPRILESPIDLTNSAVPGAWKTGGSSVNRDILFSPRGNVIGELAVAGHIHLVITSLADKDAGFTPGDQNKRDPEIVVSVTTQTGAVSSHSVYVGASPPDPFRNAETGVETE